MPQPVKDLEPYVNLKLGPLAMYARPALAVEIACVATIWGALERSMEMLILVMLGVDAKVGHTIYSALTGSMAQRAVFNSIAAARLTPDERTAFAKITESFSGRGGERNDIVHGIWAIHDKYPDALILLDMSAQIAALASWEAGEKTNATAQHALSVGRHMLYKEHDFLQVKQRMDTLLTDMFMLGAMIRNRTPVKSADNQSSDN